MKEWNITIKSFKFGIIQNNIPKWILKKDHGTNLSTGYFDFWVDNKTDIERTKKWAKENNVEIEVK